MTKKRYPIRRFGGDRRSLKRVAGTSNDRRLKCCNQLGFLFKKCIKGKLITTTQISNYITVSCECGHQYVMQVVGILSGYDVIASFNDSHP